MKNSKEIIEILVKYGVDTNKQFFDGNSLLHWAVKTRNTELIEHIISKGSNLNVKNKAGFTPLH